MDDITREVSIIILETSPNLYALTMWQIVNFNQELFKDFTKHFLPNLGPREDFYPSGYCVWMQDLLSDKNRA